MSIKGVIIFLIGAVTGSAITAYALKDYYERKADEEINSVKENLKVAVKREAREEEIRKTEAEIAEYDRELKKTGYETESDEETEVEMDPPVVHENVSDEPQVISPDEFGEYDDYDEINLTYYSDGVLADDCNNKITDVDNIVGRGNLDRIGEYEDDTLHIRNDKLKAYYEIIVDYRTYAEILKLNPHLRQ